MLDGVPLRLAQADGAGPNVDAVFLPRGRSMLVRSTGVTGNGGGSALYYLDEFGVVYGIHDDETAKHLGLEGPPTPAPWPVLGRLPRGPELSREAASVARDSFAGPS
jgi:hypothetical protein